MRRAVIADIHGNLPALEAVIADMAHRRIDAVVDLGDCVSGPLWPCETLALLREMGWPTVRGNHDRQVGEGSETTLSATDLHAWTALTTEERAWLRGLPPRIDLAPGLTAIHARPDDDNAYLLEDQIGERLVRSEAATVARRLGATAASLVLTAHSHLPGCLKLPDGPWIVNPGSVGCPAYHDDATDPPHRSEAGSPAARYAVIESADQRLMIEFLAVPYPHERAAERATACGRPDWAHALRTGFTPRAPKDTA